VLIAILLLASCAEMAAFFVLRGESRLYRVGESFPQPSGIQLNGMYFGADAACYLLRVTADGCPYCIRDAGVFTVIARRAREERCAVIALAPYVGQIKASPDTSAVQLEFVDMQLGRVLEPSLTPQTILLSGDGRLLWQRQGSLSAADEPRAMAALAGLEGAAPAGRRTRVHP
jgi:hypothetical protein